VPIILDGEPRALAEGTNLDRQHPATVGMEHPLRFVPCLDQCPTYGQHWGGAARDDAFGFGAIRASERGADGSLRELLLAISF
jgi:hypothetical protein